MQSTNPNYPNFNFLNNYSEEELKTYNRLLSQRNYITTFSAMTITGTIIGAIISSLLVTQSIITPKFASVFFLSVVLMTALVASILDTANLHPQELLTKKSKLNKISLLVQRYPLVLSYVAEVLSKDELRHIDYINIYKLKKMITNKQNVTNFKSNNIKF